MLDDLLPFSLPWRFSFDALKENHSNFNILNFFTLRKSTQCDTAQCYFTATTPEIFDWEAAYRDGL